jgi:two-component system phosphate regulon sensor histidine kinase PhoR
MPPLAFTIAESTSDSLGAAEFGWIVAGALAAAWLVTWWIRRRSLARLEQTLASLDRIPEPEGHPLAEALSAATIRRLRHERQRQERLADRLAEIERVLRATPIAVIALDHMQRVVSANPAAERLLGFEERAARGRLLQETVRQPGLNRFVTDALARDQRSEGELHLESDAPLEVQVSCEPLHAESQPAGVVVSLVDVTRMRRLESMRSEFAANVSHELRTPITNIKGYVETLLQVGIEDPATSQRFLEIIQRNTTRLSEIVEDILTLAFLEEPETPHALERDDVAVDELVARVVDELGSAAAAKSITITTECEAGVSVHVNRSLATQALANLVSNAIKYSPEGTAVVVKVRRESMGLAVFSVRDRGPGIAPKHLPRLFERFYRVDKARARTQGGTGLGLAIVKHIANIHLGRVEVTSQLGEGSDFRLLLPTEAPAAKAAQ